MKKIEVEWTGVYPNLCLGKWKIEINGKLISSKKDTDFFDDNMATSGSYEIWHFDKNSTVQWETYDETLDKDWWKTDTGIRLEKILKENKIELTDEEKRDLYNKLSENDWRHSSCGGCI